MPYGNKNIPDVLFFPIFLELDQSLVPGLLQSRKQKPPKLFVLAYPDESFVQQVAAQIPWGQHCLVLDRVKDDQERRWYLQLYISSFLFASTSASRKAPSFFSFPIGRTRRRL